MSIEVDEGAIGKRAGGAPDLYFASTMPKSSLRAVLGILHGYADHGARYRHVMGALAEHGIGSIAVDMRGHGRAAGTRGFCMQFSEFVDDADVLRRLVDERASGVPTFLFGHSFGGLVASTSVIESARKLHGLILSAPFFGLALKVPPVKIWAGKVASTLYPTLGLPSGLFGRDMSHDPVKAKAYDDDPLVFPKATARWFTETVAAQERVFQNAPRLTLPLLVSFGTADKVASMDSARRFFDSVGSSDKTWDAREGLFHEVHNEPSWTDLVETFARWMLARA
jgi:alpha-beta hydrolase superfamily lysophospholipase